MRKITICGSMHFFEEIECLKRDLEEMGFEVLIPSKEGTDLEYSKLSRKEQVNLKKEFMDRHIKRIKEADFVLMGNYTKNGMKDYIGANTFLEMGFSYILGKKIFLLNDIPQQPNSLEIEGFKPVVLQGCLERINSAQMPV